MPKIQVNEKDMSWYYRQRESGALTVFMPLLATFGPDSPTLVDESNFTQTYGEAAVGTDVSYKMAASYVKSGLNVLGKRVVLEGSVEATSSYTEMSFDKATIKEYTVILSDVESLPDIRVFIPVNSEKIRLAPGYADKFKEVVEADEAAKTAMGISSVTKGATAYVGGPAEGYTEEDHIEITAKYPGSYGNDFSIKVSKVGTLLYVFVSNSANVQIDSFVVDLFEETSDKYYELVNEESAYVTVNVVGTYDASWTVLDNRFSLYGGSDGYTTEEEAKEAVITAITTAGALSSLADPYQYSIDVVLDGGFNKYEHEDDKVNPTVLSAVDKTLAKLTHSIGTAIYFVDGSSAWQPEQFLTYCSLFDTIDGESVGSYCTAYGPYGYTKMISDGSVVKTPGSYALLVSWGQSVAVGNPVWMAPAGVKRAQLSSFYRRPIYEIGSAILDQWQNQEYTGSSVNYKVNPIMKLKQYGYCVYGNSTLLHNRPDGSTSMLQSFSVRVLANLIKKQAFDVSLNLQFDQLTDDLFAQFKTLMTTYMDQLRYGGALYDYNIIVDRSAMTNADLQNKRVPVKIQISPNPAAENFIIDLEISQAGVSFSDDTDESEIA